MIKIIAIGGSAGSLESMIAIVRRLPHDFGVPVVVTAHIGAGPSILPGLLSRGSALKAHHAIDAEPLRAGVVFVAPPDQHLLVRDGRIELSHGPKENWARPAIDPMFRSVASEFGSSAVGIVLSGSLNDGTAGLYEIKRHGGRAIVQDPKTATYPGMPQSAVDNVPIDDVLSAEEIADRLLRLVAEQEPEPGRMHVATKSTPKPQPGHHLVEPLAQTCPECGGAMREERLGNLTQFRCHTGHVMSMEVLATLQVQNLQQLIEETLRALNEREALCREAAAKEKARGHETAAATWRAAQAEALARKTQIVKLSELDWIQPEREDESEQNVAAG